MNISSHEFIRIVRGFCLKYIQSINDQYDYLSTSCNTPFHKFNSFLHDIEFLSNTLDCIVKGRILECEPNTITERSSNIFSIYDKSSNLSECYVLSSNDNSIYKLTNLCLDKNKATIISIVNSYGMKITEKDFDKYTILGFNGTFIKFSFGEGLKQKDYYESLYNVVAISQRILQQYKDAYVSSRDLFQLVKNDLYANDFENNIDMYNYSPKKGWPYKSIFCNHDKFNNSIVLDFFKEIGNAFLSVMIASDIPFSDCIGIAKRISNTGNIYYYHLSSEDLIILIHHHAKFNDIDINCEMRSSLYDYLATYTECVNYIRYNFDMIYEVIYNLSDNTSYDNIRHAFDEFTFLDLLDIHKNGHLSKFSTIYKLLTLEETDSKMQKKADNPFFEKMSTADDILEEFKEDLLDKLNHSGNIALMELEDTEHDLSEFPYMIKILKNRLPGIQIDNIEDRSSIDKFEDVTSEINLTSLNEKPSKKKKLEYKAGISLLDKFIKALEKPLHDMAVSRDKYKLIAESLLHFISLSDVQKNQHTVLDAKEQMNVFENTLISLIFLSESDEKVTHSYSVVFEDGKYITYCMDTPITRMTIEKFDGMDNKYPCYILYNNMGGMSISMDDVYNQIKKYKNERMFEYDAISFISYTMIHLFVQYKNQITVSEDKFAVILDNPDFNKLLNTIESMDLIDDPKTIDLLINCINFDDSIKSAYDNGASVLNKMNMELPTGDIFEFKPGYKMISELKSKTYESIFNYDAKFEIVTENKILTVPNCKYILSTNFKDDLVKILKYVYYTKTKEKL